MVQYLWSLIHVIKHYLMTYLLLIMTIYHFTSSITLEACVLERRSGAKV